MLSCSMRVLSVKVKYVILVLCLSAFFEFCYPCPVRGSVPLWPPLWSLLPALAQEQCVVHVVTGERVQHRVLGLHTPQREREREGERESRERGRAPCLLGLTAAGVYVHMI